MEPKEEVLKFKNYFQSLHFDKKLENGSPAEKADTLRCIMSQVNNAQALKCLSIESAVHLQKDYNQLYSSIVDSFDESTGLNNYAEGAMTLCSAYKNDSKNWRSSLTAEKVKNMESFKKMLSSCQAKCSELEQQFIAATKKHQMVLQTAARTLNNVPSNDLMTEKRSSTSDKDTRFQSSGFSSNDWKDKEECSNRLKVQIKNPNENMPKNDETSNRKIDFYGSGSRLLAEEGTVNKKPLFSAGSTKNYQTSSYIGSYHPVQSVPVLRKAESTKRPYRDISDDIQCREEGTNTFSTSAFKTAKEQLAIENQKKFGYNKGGAVSTSSYGNTKKSLGTRRGPSGKFVPPVARDQDENSYGNQRNTNRKPQKDESENEPTDERLKGIEPKMIELIMSEIMDHGPQLGWEDIAGLEFAKKTIKEIVVWPMLRPDIFTGLRGPPKGLLLFGPPGTGKTLIGKCIASQSKSTFFSISASSLTSKWVGEGEKMVKAMFAVARCHQPSVVFIDEIDSLLSQRSDTEHEASRRIKTEFLIQLDGASTTSEERILVIGATNRPQEIDEAARRRFVKRLYIPLPDSSARKQIVKNLLSSQRFQLSEDELDEICVKSDGYSGADMANLCKEAALGPIRCISFEDIENITADQVRPMMYKDFEDAFLQVKASVSDKDLNGYIEWNKLFGSGCR